MATAVDFKKTGLFFLAALSADHTQVTGEAVDVGDGSDSYGGTLANFPIEPGSFGIVEETNGEIVTDNGAGVLTGDAGGAGTINYETGVWAFIFNSAVGVSDDITGAYWYLDVDGDDLKWVEDVDIQFKAMVEDQNPQVGELAGAEGVQGDFWYELSLKVPMTPVGIQSVTGEVVGVGDGSTATFSGTLAYPGIHSKAYTPTAANLLSFTDGTETFSDVGDGTLTGSAGGTGTINYETGAFSITFNANVTNLQDVTAGYTYLELPECDWLLRLSHKRVWIESGAEYGWRYYPTDCGHQEIGFRCIYKGSGCTEGLDHRGGRCRLVPVFKAGKGQRLMIEASGMAAARTEPLHLPALPTRANLSARSVQAFTNTKATLTLTAKDPAGDSTFAGRLVGDFEQRTPFTAERLATATGDDSGGTAEVMMSAPADARTEIDISVGLTKASAFSLRKHLVNGTRFEHTMLWYNRRTPVEKIRYSAVYYAADVEKVDEQEVCLARIKGKLIYGLPTQSNPGRDMTLPLGAWDFIQTK